MRNWQKYLLAASTQHRIYSTHNTHAPFWSLRIVTIAARNRAENSFKTQLYFVDCNNEISRWRNGLFVYLFVVSLPSRLSGYACTSSLSDLIIFWHNGCFKSTNIYLLQSIRSQTCTEQLSLLPTLSFSFCFTRSCVDFLFSVFARSNNVLQEIYLWIKKLKQNILFKWFLLIRSRALHSLSLCPSVSRSPKSTEFHFN